MDKQIPKLFSDISTISNDNDLSSNIVKLLHKTDPYLNPELDHLSEDLQGWGSKRNIFKVLIKELSPQLIIEVGSWKGASAIFMGQFIRELGLSTQIVCVDTWLGSLEHLMKIDHPEKAWWYDSLQHKNGFPQIYYQFLKNVISNNLQKYITPFPNTSGTAAKWFLMQSIKADLIYIDASHEEDDVYSDICQYYEILNQDGIIFGDDYVSFGVAPAVERFARERGLEIEFADDGRLWIIRKNSNITIKIPTAKSENQNEVDLGRELIEQGLEWDYWKVIGYEEKDVEDTYIKHLGASVGLKIDISEKGIETQCESNSPRDIEEKENIVIGLFQEALEINPNLRGSYYVHLGDDQHSGKFCSSPVLSFRKDRSDSSTVLIPDPRFVQTEGYINSRNDIDIFESGTTWTKKNPTLFWRGAFSEREINSENWENNLRIKLCRAAKKINDTNIMDAHISGLVGVNEGGIRDRIQESGFVKEWIKVIDFYKYKFLISIDELSCPCESLFLSLYSKSLIVMVESEKMHWFSPALKAWVHYVPLKSDLSDLDQIISWIHAHDKECEQIALNGRELAKQIVATPPAKYLASVLTALSKFRRD